MWCGSSFANMLGVVPVRVYADSSDHAPGVGAASMWKGHER
jgi:hypothetical protein